MYTKERLIEMATQRISTWELMVKERQVDLDYFMAREDKSDIQDIIRRIQTDLNRYTDKLNQNKAELEELLAA